MAKALQDNSCKLKANEELIPCSKSSASILMSSVPLFSKLGSQSTRRKSSSRCSHISTFVSPWGFVAVPSALSLGAQASYSGEGPTCMWCGVRCGHLAAGRGLVGTPRIPNSPGCCCQNVHSSSCSCKQASKPPAHQRPVTKGANPV